MENLYLELLLKQYKESGKNNLSNYLKEIKKELEIYKQCLKDDKILDNIYLELDKGEFDSISSQLMDIVLLTRFKNSFDDYQNKRIILDGNLTKTQNGVIIRSKDSKQLFPILKNNNLYCITQNPFNFEKSCSDLIFLYEQGYNVILGMYGLIEDMDYQGKILKLKEFKDIISGIIVEKNIQNMYVSYVKSKNNSK